MSEASTRQATAAVPAQAIISSNRSLFRFGISVSADEDV
jgi:hypothetical protein